MPCYSPIKAFKYYSIPLQQNVITFNWNEAKKHIWFEQPMPCLQCVGCRLENSRQLAIRCVHEASLHEQNCWLTLTYSPENLRLLWNCQPTLVKKDFQDFIKRLRYHIDAKIRYLHCGEYGEKFNRPHYHALIFGFDFKDKAKYKKYNGNQYYTSHTLTKLWGLGHAVIGEITPESSAYTTRYALKKITGEQAKNHYEGRQPEYITMSLKPAIGLEWYNIHKDEIYPNDYVDFKGYKAKPPRYYDKKYQLTNEDEFDLIKLKRKIKVMERLEKTVDTLEEQKEKLLTRISKLKRTYEIDKLLD